MLPIRHCKSALNRLLLSRTIQASLSPSLISCHHRTLFRAFPPCSTNSFHILTSSESLSLPITKTISALHISKRCLAKSRDKVKERKADKPKVMLTDDEMEKVLRYDDFKQEVEMIIDAMKNDLKLNYNVRVNPRQIENLEITYDGVKVTIADLITINRKGQDLVLNFSATPEATKPAMNAIHSSGLQLGTQQDGNVIYVSMPKVTTEHRQALIKSVQMLGQKTKDHIKDRNFQKKFFVKDGELKKLSQDLVKDAMENLNYYIKQKNTTIAEICVQKCDSLENN